MFSPSLIGTIIMFGMFFNFYFIILMIRIFSDCKISYTFPIHKTLAEFFFAKAENVLPNSGLTACYPFSPVYMWL